jgi:hypothetical protein
VEKVTAASPFAEKVTAVTVKGDCGGTKPAEKVTTESPQYKKENREENKEEEEETLYPSSADDRKEGLGGEGRPADLFESPASESESFAPAAPESGSPPKKRARAGAEIAAAFESFWRVYPRKVAKLAALKAFESALAGGATAAAIISGAERYRTERANEEARYTKHPSTWLAKGCWEDESPPNAAGPPVLDNAGNVIPSPPAPRPNGRGGQRTMDDLLQAIKAGWQGGPIGGRHD